MWNPFRRRSPPAPTPQPDPAGVFRGLREQVLTLPSEKAGAVPTQARPNVWGVVMDTGFPTATATLLSLADGTTSLYFSSGGGVIGAGELEPVRAQGEQWLDVAESMRAHLTSTTATPLPDPGEVIFYVLTFGGTHTARAPEADLRGEAHPLHPLYVAAQRVLTVVRMASERQQQGRQGG